MEKTNLFLYLLSIKGASRLAVILISVASIIYLTRVVQLNIFQMITTVVYKLTRFVGRVVHRTETSYRRDLEIGKLNEKMARVKIYRFLNDLTIDLGLKKRGATPYAFLFLVLFLTLVGTIIVLEGVFNNLWLLPFMYPIFLAGVICTLYTKANLAHDARIENVIEAENIISNNITKGVLVAVRENFTTLPPSLQTEFQMFLDSVEHQNIPIRLALLNLSMSLGSVSEDFIKKCIVFETEEKGSMAGIFKDVVEVNNMKMEMRREVKRRFEEVLLEYSISGVVVVLFLLAPMLIYDFIGKFYFTTMVGNLLLALDVLILISVFVFITFLRAREV